MVPPALTGGMQVEKDATAGTTVALDSGGGDDGITQASSGVVGGQHGRANMAPRSPVFFLSKKC